jgi:hypothetical protein
MVVKISTKAEDELQSGAFFVISKEREDRYKNEVGEKKEKFLFFNKGGNARTSSLF